MNRYIEFNAVKFLKESVNWEHEKAELNYEMDSLANPKGSGNSRSHSSRPGDSTATAVVERSRIQSQINRLELYEEAFTYAWNHLSEAFRDVLTTFFFEKGYKSKRVREYSAKYAMCINDVYKTRREALAEFSRLITRRYNL